jgi:hypothetical protein
MDARPTERAPGPDAAAVHRRRRRALLRWLGVATPLLVLGASEVGLRLTAAERLRLQTYPLVYQPDEHTGYRYIPGATSAVCNPALCRPVVINARGHCGPDFSVQKEPGTFRAAVLVESDGTGIWTDDGSEFITLLGQALKAELPRSEVLNLSIDGRFRDLENVRAARQAAQSYKPDLLLLIARFPLVTARVGRTVYRGYVLMYPREHPEALADLRRDVDWIEEHRALIWLYRRSFTVRMLARYLAYHRGGTSMAVVRAFIERRHSVAHNVVPLSVRQTLREFVDLEQTVRAYGGRLVLLTEDRQLEQLLGERNIDFVTFSLGFVPVGLSVNGAGKGKDNHLDRAGHEYARDRLLPAVLERVPPQFQQAEPTRPTE